MKYSSYIYDCIAKSVDMKVEEIIQEVDEKWAKDDIFDSVCRWECISPALAKLIYESVYCSDSTNND